MNPHLPPGFGPLELEELAGRDQASAQAHLAGCDACAAAFREAGEALADLALSLPPVQPSPGLRDRVLHEAVRRGRFERFAAQVAELADLTVEAALALLARMDDAAAWVQSELPGVQLFHLDAGPRLANAVVGFVRIAPGQIFPEHTHHGDEVALVLQGSCVEDSGRVSRSGDLVRMDRGTTHALRALPGPPFIYLAAVDHGFTMFGVHFKPGDARA